MKGNGMASMADIEQFSSSLVRQFQPKRIVLFGSHAWGTPTPDSDVDLLVVLPFEGKVWRMALAIREKVHPGFPLDLLVRTEAQVTDRLKHNDSFLTEVVTKGMVLYEG
jgi:predicted nucleotidyltransferase